MGKTVQICTAGECGGECYKCRCDRLVEQNQQLQTQFDDLYTAVTITADWSQIIDRRNELLLLKETTRLTSAQAAELDNLERSADILLRLLWHEMCFCFDAGVLRPHCRVVRRADAGRGIDTRIGSGH